MSGHQDKTSSTVTLSRDEVWDAFQVGPYASFCGRVSQAIQGRNELPQKVKERLGVIEALLHHSYFEYDFLDVAMERMLFTFEMALRTRLEEIDVAAPDHLVKCIKVAAKQHLFEDGADAAHIVRKFRNRSAHPERNSRHGPMALSIIERVMSIINGMYEDLMLRAERQKEREKLQSELDACVKDGGIAGSVPLDAGDGAPKSENLLVYDVSVLYVNNHGPSTEYHVALFPIFEVRSTPLPDVESNSKSEDRGHIKISAPLFLIATEWEALAEKKKVVLFLEDSGDEVVLSPIKASENRRIYDERWGQQSASSDQTVVIEERYRQASGRQNELIRRSCIIPGSQ